MDAAGAGEGTCCRTGEVAKENLAKSSVQKSPVERLVRLDLLNTPIFVWVFFSVHVQSVIDLFGRVQPCGKPCELHKLYSDQSHCGKKGSQF